MRPVAVILMVVAVFAAGLTAFLAKRWLDGQAVRQAGAEQARLIEVLVVAREVPAGSSLQSDDLRYEGWPAGAVTPRLVVRKPGEDPKGQFLGLVARRPLGEGEPFTAASTFRHDESGVLAGMLGAGMRAVSINVTAASGVSGFITPGDRVDVVLSADFRKAEQGEASSSSGPLVRFAAETVLEDVKVLAIDQQIARARDGSAIQGKTATVEVTPKQAEKLIAAGMLGQLSLVLRGTGKEAAADAAPPAAALPNPFTPDLEASKALSALHGGRAKAPARSGSGGAQVQVNRAGHVSTQSLAR